MRAYPGWNPIASVLGWERERDRAAALVENKPRFRRWLCRTNANNGVSLSGVAGFPIDILTYLSPAMMCCMYYSCVSVLNVAEMDKACWRANVLNADPFIEQLGFYLSNQLVNLLVNKYLCIIASNVKWLRKKAFKIYVSKLIFLIKLLYLYPLTDLLRYKNNIKLNIPTLNLKLWTTILTITFLDFSFKFVICRSNILVIKYQHHLIHYF